jgi:hypothetical protein
MILVAGGIVVPEGDAPELPPLDELPPELLDDAEEPPELDEPPELELLETVAWIVTDRVCAGIETPPALCAGIVNVPLIGTVCANATLSRSDAINAIKYFKLRFLIRRLPI